MDMTSYVICLGLFLWARRLLCKTSGSYRQQLNSIYQILYTHLLPCKREGESMTDVSTMRLDGQVAIVTGGGTGIGAATAKLFAEVGASVVIANRRASTGEAVVKEIEGAGGTATFISTDVSDPAQVRAMVDHAIEQYGRLDILFNNAGLAIVAPFWELSDEDWQFVVAVNLSGHFYCAKYAVPHMLEQGGGAIVNMSSVLGYATNRGMTAYTSTKTGIVGMTKAMALDLADKNIRVNCIVPGSIDTPMMWDSYPSEELSRIEREAAEAVPVGRVAPPEEIASAVLFLVSPAASLVTGTTLIADGALLTKIATEY
jgi:NAD(P)-dependent dehydrogenase (short-subunit alcohol dehydrogenase family)